jgi:hypothetical protein
MSILLRKQCQPHLDKIGLDLLHVAVNNKVLTIEGECGQTLVLINGIQFQTSQPKTKELEYAEELFIKFLHKHKELLVSLIAKKRAFKLLKAPELPENYKTSYTDIVYVPITNTSNTLNFYPNGTVKPTGPITIDALISTYETNKLAVNIYFKEKLQYDNVQKEWSELVNQMNSCDI